MSGPFKRDSISLSEMAEENREWRLGERGRHSPDGGGSLGRVLLGRKGSRED